MKIRNTLSDIRWELWRGRFARLAIHFIKGTLIRCLSSRLPKPCLVGKLLMLPSVLISVQMLYISACMRLFTRLQAVADEPVGFKRHAVEHTTICIDRSRPCPAVLQRFVGKATASTVCHISPQQVLVEPGTQSDLRVPGFSVSHVALAAAKKRRDLIQYPYMSPYKFRIS